MTFAPTESSAASRRTSLTDSLWLFFGSWTLFLINIRYPQGRNFDEFHYIPSALQWLGLKENQNWEHPPLAKQLIAIGVGIFGDNPVGWRFMSTLFGALTLVGMYHLGHALFRNRTQALWVAALTVLNQLLYVQARIAMLDSFMMAFLAWGLWALVRALDESPDYRKWILTSGVFMALAIACKWFAIVPYILGMGLLAGQAFANRSWSKFYDLIAYYVAIPLAVYYATFLPYLLVEKTPPFTLGELLTDAQTRMLDGQKRVVNNHPYMSQWWQWIFMERPIWYAFDREPPNFVRGVIMLGNPLIMWGGLVALVVCLVDFIRTRGALPFLILIFYGAFAFCWIAIPRKVAFYYYYYPAGMMLSLALVYALFKVRWTAFRYVFLGATLGLFIFFFPILAALKIPADSFTRWMWFRTWI